MAANGRWSMADGQWQTVNGHGKSHSPSAENSPHPSSPSTAVLPPAMASVTRQMYLTWPANNGAG